MKRMMIFTYAMLFAVVAQVQQAVALPQFSSEKCYKLMHVSTGSFLLLHDSYNETNAVNATTLDDQGSLFTVTQSGSGYVFTKRGTDKTLGISTQYPKWNTSNTGATAWKLTDAGGDNVYITSEKGYLAPEDGTTGSGEYVYTNKTKGDNAKWQIVDGTGDLPNYVGSITSGKYYRLISNAYDGKTMAANANGGIDLATAPNLNKNDYAYYAQIWQISGNNGRYQFKNLVSGRSIQGWPGQSQQWKTGTGTPAKFYSGKSTSGDNTVFWFATVNNTSEHKSLHAAGAADQNNTVVGWQASSAASKWLLWEVEVTDEDLANAEDWQKAFNSNVGSEYIKFFTDNACSQLKSEYASMSDDELREAMNSVPSMMREEAVRVKNDRWGANATWSRYEKDFRIHDYEVYSAPGVWGSKLGFGDFGRLTQPTGIRAKAGELVYLFVNEAVKTDGRLWVEMPVGTKKEGPQTELRKGCNILVPSEDCELFITYQNTNTEKPLSAFPDIKIHIIGGTCNGAFDIVRGHTDKDWQWFKQNMFKDKYLHIRTKCYVYCGHLNSLKSMTAPVRSMQMQDFTFEAQERTMTTRFHDGYYRPTVTIIDANAAINPNAAYGRVEWGYLDGYYVFNEDMLKNGGWYTSWAMPHELGHLHQKPLWLAGTREGSNEALVQIYTHLWGKKTAKGPQSILANHFNKEGGTGWIDILKSDKDIQSLCQKIWYQLWLYFHQKGDDEFFPRWIECIKNRGLFQSRFTSWENPALIDKDYMRMALAACEASQTDLYEFFKVWGFFNYAENMNDCNENGVVRIADYENYYLKVPRKSVPAEVAQMEAWKKEMQRYQKKAPGVMFINSTAEQGKITADAEVAKYFPSLVGTNVENYGAADDVGCTGYYTRYGKNEAKNLGFKLSGTTVTITGSGAVGFKVYDDKGELIWISFKKSFATNKTIANGITNGTYSLVASLGDDTDLLLSGPPTEYSTDTNGIEAIDNGQPTTDSYYTIDGVKLHGKPTAKGIYIVGGRKVVIR